MLTRQPVIFILGNKTITTDNDLIVQITTELGYAGPNGTRWQADMDDLERVLSETHSACLLLIDGISENNNIIAMKNAIRELLFRYGNNTHFKFCFSCRDIFWIRFANEFKGYIYLTQDQKISAGNTHLGVHLKDWSNSELDIAIKKYKAYFKIQFSLTPDVKNQCKYPLLFRLFCETYSGRSIGLISRLPLYQVFEDYLNIKIDRIADYLNLSFPPDELFSLLRNIRERMWTNDDIEEIKKSELLKMLFDMYAQNPYEILERMLDEGLFLQISNGGDTFIRFSFDELADYLLYLVFMNNTKNSNQLKIRDIIDDQVKLLENDDQKIKAEKFLVLISRSLENSDDIDFLLETTLAVDLFVFSKCCWQRILLDVPTSKTDLDIVEIFGQNLIHYYGQIIDRYFSTIQELLTPFDSGKKGELGISAKGSPKLREVSYSYKLQPSGAKLVEAKLDNKFPTWQLSIVDEKSGKELQLHDPEHGFAIPYRSSSLWGTPLRTLDFEWDSPFSGVSIMAPDRLALYDIQQEIKKILDSHKIDEQSLLLPKPDLPRMTDKFWKEYSEQQLFDYMQALFSHFIHIYQEMIEKNLPKIASRMNLYNQCPVHCVILIDKERDFIKLFLAPTEGEDPEIQAKYLPDGISLNVSNGGLRLEGDIPFEAYIKQALNDSKRYKTNSYPIEKTIALKELFGETPLNTLLYQWLLSELTDILQVPIFADDI